MSLRQKLVRLVERTGGPRTVDALRVARRELRLLPYLGFRFRCRFCGGSFRKMKPYTESFSLRGRLIDHYTENAICPRCGSDIRFRFALEFLLQRRLLDGPVRLLFFAPDRWLHGALSKHSGVEVTACDIEPQWYPGAIQVDITDTGLADESYDAIICMHVLEHVSDDAKALRELYRVLEPCGWALLAVPILGDETFEDPSLDAEERQRFCGLSEHLRMYGLDFASRISAHGFETEVVTIDDLSGNYVDRSAASPHMDSDKHLFFARKPG